MFYIYIYLSFLQITLLITMALLLTNYFIFNDDVIEDVFSKKEHEMFLEINEFVFVYDLPLIELLVYSLVHENFMDACQ